MFRMRMGSLPLHSKDIMLFSRYRMMDLIFKTLSVWDAMCHGKSLTNTEWFLVFTCLAILIAQLQNLNSIAWNAHGIIALAFKGHNVILKI
ncbi:lysine histidine transporter-like 8 [Quercus suber]|uniref:Lysine histidine transporter-like 8 n=1 Tax=Quercus suber TaxID=58331 RepID=A0AAW0LA10_QUESU